MLSWETFTHLGILALNAVLNSKNKNQKKKQNQKPTMQRIKTYFKSECSSTTKSHLKVDLEWKKTLDPMNANIDLVTFNYI